MNSDNVIVAKDKRYEVMQKIFDLVENEFQGLDISTAFTKRLLLDAVTKIEERSMDVPLSYLNSFKEGKER